MPEDVQPPEGQGDEAAGGLFDSYLQSVPEDQRATVEPFLKDASKHVDSRLQEAADIKKALGPYQGISLDAYTPDELSQLIAWHQGVSASPDAYKQWLTQEAKEAGLTLAEAEEQVETAEAEGELTPERVKQLIDEQAEQRLAPVQESLEELRNERNVDKEEMFVRGELTALEAEHKVTLSEEQKEMVCDLGLNYDGDESWVKHGFDRFREITNAGQRAFVEEKAAQPTAGLQAGGNAAPPGIKTFQDAEKAARERFAQST